MTANNLRDSGEDHSHNLESPKFAAIAKSISSPVIGNNLRDSGENHSLKMESPKSAEIAKNLNFDLVERGECILD